MVKPYSTCESDDLSVVQVMVAPVVVIDEAVTLDMTGGVGATSLFTFTLTPEEVVVLLDGSLATAVMV